ncbi:MAG: ribonuclease HII, partial [Chloroflexi bacterium RBG_13_66_10]
MRHTAPTLRLEARLWKAGIIPVAGLDEAGRGAWAGPIVAAAVVLPADRRDLRRILAGVRDSKEMTSRQRELWAGRIREIALAVGVGEAASLDVDGIGPLRATRLAMHRALQALAIEPRFLLLDFMRLPEIPLPQTCLPHGDGLALSISAASVIAKVWRDEGMKAIEGSYPGYGFARHKGYGTASHREALGRLGPCPIHRSSFAP